MYITACVIGYVLAGLVITVGAMKYDSTVCRDCFDDADAVLMLRSVLLWPVTMVLLMLDGVAKLFRL